MKKNTYQLFTIQLIFFVFLVMTIALTHALVHAASLQMPVSVSSGSTKSLSVQLDVESAIYTLLGPSPTAKNGPSENPVVSVRAAKLTHSKPAASQSANHLLVGPTLRVRPGDKLNILFRNNLNYEKSAGDASHSTTNPHGFDVINLHTHGLHVSPRSPSDNVLLNIFPKKTPKEPLNECYAEFGKENCVTEKFSYTYKIPVNHPSGTYWYHAHKHGAVAMHLANGIAGALIIEDPAHGLESLPAVQKAREQIILLQEVAYGGKYPDGTGSGTKKDPYRIDCMSVYGNQNGCAFGGQEPPAPGITNNELSVNGQFQPSITLSTNEAQLWRVINGSIGNVVPMCLMPVNQPNDKSATTTPVAYVLAADGVPVQNPDAGKNDLPVLLASPVVNPTDGAGVLNNELLFLAAGQRLDLMVKAPSTPGTYALYDGVDQSGSAIPRDQLCQASTYAQLTPILTVNVEVSTSEIAYNTDVPTQQALNRLTAPITITAAESPELPTQGAVFGFTNSEFAPIDGGASVINARVFNPIRSQRNLALKQVDLWSAQSAAGTHMFHIHINSFQLVSRGQVKYPFPIWRDTLLVETQSDKEGNAEIGDIVQFLQKPLDYTGSLVMHCHNVFHEDNGMMELVNILPSSSDSHSPVHKKHAGIH
ncbi:multicopper oxidase family protein [Nitrosomonas sp.]|uniref:multicopper oxidase family protein n=1 Tax=Nitrosomonas sp. TaxID=42353 RepID=UPI002724F662|nr:multicopper oxidase domain-containing protein [Nitrosomonas sp.]MDO8895310.1 multicopper oxidase domain-containing protein [Nitrosomonas sp.]